ncbi:MAG: hypothetical protein RR619_04565, partial [Raoultibacter sp.]
MANPENLIPNDQRTPSQRRANASKAGKASAKARRERKAMRELAQIVLDTPMKAGKRDTINTIEDLKKEGGPNISVEEFALFNIARKAMSGDV